MRIGAVLLAAAALIPLSARFARADEIAEWNAIMFQAALASPDTSPFNMSRNAAIVHAAIFDAVNGIERRFASIKVEAVAPPGASQRAAAVQAAYATLTKLYPGQLTVLVERRTRSLAEIASDPAENPVSIQRGVEWGQKAATDIWSWRSTDGGSTVLPPLPDGREPGQWRKTPPGFQPAAGRQLAEMTSWVIPSASLFRPGQPPSLTSEQYATNLAEVKDGGRDRSTTRTGDLTLLSLFWNSATPSYIWNTVALSLAVRRGFTFSERVRLLGLLNLAIADAAIACWEAKYTFLWWRPVTAIRTSGIPADTSWSPLLATPAHPDYPSGHSCMSGAAGRLLSVYFGEFTNFSVISDARAMEGVSRSFSSFAAATAEVKDARVFAGIHFRAACDAGETVGAKVADFVLERGLLPATARE